MVDRLPEAWQELFVRGAEGALAMWLETVRGRE